MKTETSYNRASEPFARGSECISPREASHPCLSLRGRLSVSFAITSLLALCLPGALAQSTLSVGDVQVLGVTADANVNGASTLTLSGNNSISGVVSVTEGTLTAAATGNQALGNVTSVAITGGTLLLGASNQLDNSASITIGASGTFASGGFSEGKSPAGPAQQLGALILEAESAIDFLPGSNGSSLLFSGLTYKGGSVAIRNWSGAIGSDNASASNDRLLFIGDSGLSGAELAQIQFFNDSGNPLGTGAAAIAFDRYTQIVPVPEPASIIGALGLIGFVGFRERRRLGMLAFFRRGVRGSTLDS